MALTNVCILKYNNYYDRISKQPSYYSGTDNVVSQYINLSPTYYEQFTGINFYKADGVDTELTVNTTKQGCDYLVEYDSYNTVLSRWFIIECKQTRAGQSILQLHRDLVIDNYLQIKNAPVYVEKATIKNNNDVAIYNQEDIKFNTIKQSETLLKDQTKTPWIVGYVVPPYTGEQSVSVSVLPQSLTGYLTCTSLASWDYYDFTLGNRWVVRDSDINHIIINCEERDGLDRTGNTVQYDVGNNYITVTDSIKWSGTVQYNKKSELNDVLMANVDNIWNKFYELYPTYSKKIDVLKLNGRYLLDKSTNKIYQISCNTIDTACIEHPSKGDAIDTAFNTYIRSLSNLYAYGAGSSTQSSFYFTLETTSITMTLTEITVSDTLHFSAFSGTERALIDAPYRMFAIPLESINITGNSLNFATTSKATSLNIATQLAQALTKERLIDFQLVPYCPLQNYITADKTINTTGLTENVDYVLVKDSNNVNKNIMFLCSVSNFTFDINYAITTPNTILDKKVSNQCDKFRLCSPNYSSFFDFNPIKANGVTKFNIDITYKPYTPYIHIIGDFGGLYGSSYTDNSPVGLICQGDFSIPFLTDKWQEYQINNKNYLNSFNRQVESIELNNKYQKIGDILSAITGIVGAGVSGIITGGLLGNGVMGGIAGSVASAGGGLIDVLVNEKLRRDALDLTKDQFNYSLDNIQSLPTTLAKVSSYDFNNKLFPILEYYTCTEQEREIFKDKLKYNGMTIMRIDKLINFITTTEQYFKGKLIRVSDLSDDFHTANMIAKELNQGIYISQPNENL